MIFRTPIGFETAPPLVLTSRDVEIRLRFHVMTAYFGGGVEGGVSDPITPFRASAIRGHLRWFWRATRGGRFHSRQELLSREGEIWGSTAKASPVRIEVLNGVLGTALPAKRREGDRTMFEQPSYVLFPAQSKDVRTIFKKGSFEVRVCFSKKVASEVQDDVDAALRHWISFGGIGARTRRGLGALYCASPDYTGLQNYLNPRDLMGEGNGREWSVLKGGRLVIGQAMTWDRAWLESVRVLQEYRQQRFRPQGRSTWPEPDAIRRLRGQRASHHSQDLRHEDVFPRASLGLPIIFHFKTPGDPADQELVIDDETDRMASPVIVKPMAISATEAVPLLLALNAPPAPAKLTLKQGGAETTVSRGRTDVVTELVNRAAAKWKVKGIGL